MENEKIAIGVSSCLLGQKVRYNGQHKQHWYINEVLAHHFRYVAVCPEVEVGMGVPRKTVRLEGATDNPKMVEPTSNTDWTTPMNKYATKKVKTLDNLSGYIFKKGSPSCGLFRMKVYQKNGIPLAKGQGLFAKALTEHNPLLPTEEEGRLNDSHLRENFIERVFCYHRLKNQMNSRFQRKLWVEFHTKSKFLLLSHSRKHYTELGQLVANIAQYKPSLFVEKYSKTYMDCLQVKATSKKHRDVMQHILGFLKEKISKPERKSILESIDNYAAGHHPLIVPLTLLKHYIKLLDVEYIQDQFYLNPHPENLGLRNHI